MRATWPQAHTTAAPSTLFAEFGEEAEARDGRPGEDDGVLARDVMAQLLGHKAVELRLILQGGQTVCTLTLLQVDWDLCSGRPDTTLNTPGKLCSVVCSLPNHCVSKMMCCINLYGALTVGHEYFKQMSQQSVVVEMRFCGWGRTQLLNTLVPLKKTKNEGEPGFRGKPLSNVKMSAHKQLATLLALTLLLLSTSWTALAWLASIYIIAFSY